MLVRVLMNSITIGGDEIPQHLYFSSLSRGFAKMVGPSSKNNTFSSIYGWCNAIWTIKECGIKTGLYRIPFRSVQGHSQDSRFLFLNLSPTTKHPPPSQQSDGMQGLVTRFLKVWKRLNEQARRRVVEGLIPTHPHTRMCIQIMPVKDPPSISFYFPPVWVEELTD